MRGLDDEVIPLPSVSTDGIKDENQSQSAQSVSSEFQKNITIHPNPGKDNITVVSEMENCLFELIDAIGTVQKLAKLHQGSNTINTSSLQQGDYIYRVVTGDKVVTGKWVKM